VGDGAGGHRHQDHPVVTALEGFEGQAVGVGVQPTDATYWCNLLMQQMGKRVSAWGSFCWGPVQSYAWREEAGDDCAGGHQR
jgi:hypothetical protein